ncbi:hypothetical protein M0813_11424 [Anaeramoeba flamelloides]|uniref:Uncharacterized protein n=1 Tax=Anaeramoeba flamelloides TaxID=1746091 RepID=A0ABQ8ZF64_9EUKA|nr:hypothetical protein M0813_11424 [Anaeramoeba flamelloides]
MFSGDFHKIISILRNCSVSLHIPFKFKDDPLLDLTSRTRNFILPNENFGYYVIFTRQSNLNKEKEKEKDKKKEKEKEKEEFWIRIIKKIQINLTATKSENQRSVTLPFVPTTKFDLNNNSNFHNLEKRIHKPINTPKINQEKEKEKEKKKKKKHKEKEKFYLGFDKNIDYKSQKSDSEVSLQKSKSNNSFQSPFKEYTINKKNKNTFNLIHGRFRKSVEIVTYYNQKKTKFRLSTGEFVLKFQTKLNLPTYSITEQFERQIAFLNNYNFQKKNNLKTIILKLEISANQSSILSTNTVNIPNNNKSQIKIRTESETNQRVEEMVIGKNKDEEESIFTNLMKTNSPLSNNTLHNKSNNSLLFNNFSSIFDDEHNKQFSRILQNEIFIKDPIHVQTNFLSLSKTILISINIENKQQKIRLIIYSLEFLLKSTKLLKPLILNTNSKNNNNNNNQLQSQVTYTESTQLNLDEYFTIREKTNFLNSNEKLVLYPLEKINIVFTLEPKVKTIGKIRNFFGLFSTLLYCKWGISLTKGVLTKEIPVFWQKRKDSEIQVRYEVKNKIIINQDSSVNLEIINFSNKTKKIRIAIPLKHKKIINKQMYQLNFEKRSDVDQQNNNNDGSDNNNNSSSSSNNNNQLKTQSDTSILCIEKSKFIKLSPNSSSKIKLNFIPLKQGFLQLYFSFFDLVKKKEISPDYTCTIFVHN